MDKIKIAVVVPARVALREGRAVAGRSVWTPTDAELAALSTEERAALAAFIEAPNGSALELDTADITLASVHRAVAALLARKQAEADAHEARLKERRDAMFAVPPADRVIRDGTTTRGVPQWRVAYAFAQGMYGDEVRARYPELAQAYTEAVAEADRRTDEATKELVEKVRARSDEELLTRYKGAWTTNSAADEFRTELGARYAALLAEAARRNEAETAALAARKAAVKSALRGLARGVDALARAEAEGYEVESGALEHLFGAVVAPWKDAYTRWYDAWDGDVSDVEVSDRASPHAGALAFRDEVLAHLRGLTLPAGMELHELPASAKAIEVDPSRFALQVSRVSRVKYATEKEDEDGDKVARLTGVAIWLTACGYTTKLAVLRSPSDKG